MQKTLRKPVLAAAALAAGAAIALTGCSSDDTKEAVSSAASSATEAASSAADSAQAAVQGLDVSKAQEIVRTAVDPDTPSDQIGDVVDVSTPGTEQAITGFAKGASRAGYTPDIFTVKSVKSTDKVDGNDAATVTVAVASPHAPDPIDLDLVYVKVGDDWKLSADAVTQLSSMAERR
ncbi:hypothetical protein GOHSU_06_00520 [Gordonia hirsuta DSM 44140 = NBRC 16056]|uniref:Low molecular weight antigen MTB12-like C-terminal domain-containing protein n=1 Tax=Gordonia hirsuta DSM 44140 = NBRC 16056 TaxID=1121927 RepID=L7L5M6_9ACTN|nr:hypothetical protein GOHSU_06_00520 [Gordonia hirsuta DSM 44140 = NBRC 16056]